MWDEIIDPFRSLNGCDVGIGGWIKTVMTHIIMDVITYPWWEVNDLGMVVIGYHHHQRQPVGNYCHGLMNEYYGGICDTAISPMIMICFDGEHGCNNFHNNTRNLIFRRGEGWVVGVGSGCGNIQTQRYQFRNYDYKDKRCHDYFHNGKTYVWRDNLCIETRPRCIANIQICRHVLKSNIYVDIIWKVIETTNTQEWPYLRKIEFWGVHNSDDNSEDVYHWVTNAPERLEIGNVTVNNTLFDMKYVFTTVSLYSVFIFLNIVIP